MITTINVEADEWRIQSAYRYEVESLKNSGTNKWGEGTVTLKDVPTSRNETDWQGKPRVRLTNFIKLDGHRFIQFNPWVFRKLNASELREISLSTVLDGEAFDYTVDTTSRKIDNVENKNLELMKIISKSILDSKRHHLGIVDWACKKINHRMDVKIDDFEELMNMSLKEILEKI